MQHHGTGPANSSERQNHVELANLDQAVITSKGSQSNNKSEEEEDQEDEKIVTAPIVDKHVLAQHERKLMQKR